MEQMADIHGVSPEDMAEFNSDMAAQVAQIAPETAGVPASGSVTSG